jgi:site-specific DNA-methyltransferase (adenine-specific)
MTLDNIYNMDSLEGMRQMEAESVDLTVTSPPYDNLRTYNGYCFDFENIARELYRVTKQGGVVVWVVNDATIDGSETGTSFRQALFFMEIGFNLHDTMIWQKPAPIPNDPKAKRYMCEFEYMFVFSKGAPKVCNYLMAKCLNAGHIKKDDYGNRKVNGDKRKDRWDDSRKVKEFKVLGNIWPFSNTQNNTGHPAIFPVKLARCHIYSWSNECDVVLDPFMGSGTTAIACIKERRHFIGFELSKEYFDKAVKRIKAEQAQLTLF